MLIKDLHKDIQRYLENDCYCQYEIYDMTGFFYQLFKPEEECELLGIKEDKTILSAISKDQILWFDIKDDKVVEATRFDATENNIKIMKYVLADRLEEAKQLGLKIDEFKQGSTANSLKEIMSIADAIMIS